MNSDWTLEVIVQNITFMPAKFTWKLIEEFFEIEELPIPVVSIYNVYPLSVILSLDFAFSYAK